MPIQIKMATTDALDVLAKIDSLEFAITQLQKQYDNKVDNSHDMHSLRLALEDLQELLHWFRCASKAAASPVHRI
jgi:hypothetical protein